MSAFLCSNSTISAIAQLFCQISEEQGDGPADQLIQLGTELLMSGGKSYEEAQQQATHLVMSHPITIEEIVHQILLVENVESLKARYDDPWMYENAKDYRFEPRHEIIEWMDEEAWGNFKVIIDCFEYQSCEHKEWMRSLGHSVCHWIKRTLIKEFGENKTSVSRGELWDWKPSKQLEADRATLERLFSLPCAS